NDIQGAAQSHLPGRRAVRAATLYEPRADQDVRIAVLQGAEEAGDLFRLVIEVCIHGDDAIARWRDSGKASSEGSAEAARLLLVEDANVRDFGGETLRDRERSIRPLDDIEKLPCPEILNALLNSACQRL